MEIKINVINEMKRLRSNTYSDKYTWVDEIIQNCQRAKATNVRVEITNKKVIVSDNGVGCTNPEELFEKNVSGWDCETVTNENPFGEGFFSTIVVANTIIVESIGFKAVFDVNKMFNENNINAVTVTPNNRKSGFRITLKDFLPNVYRYEIENRFKEVAKYIKTPRIAVNGSIVKFEGINCKENKPYIHKIDNPLFKGWIRPYSYKLGDYGFNDIIKCFAFDRLIKDSKEFNGITGAITFKPNTINLRAPDRKEFIFDAKYYTAKEMLDNEIAKCYFKVVKNGSDKDIKALETYITNYLDVDDYKNYVKFKFYPKSNASKNENVDNVETDDNSIDETPFNNIINTEIDTSNNDISNTSSISAKISITNNTNNAQTGEKLDRTNNYGFYVKEEDIENYADILALAEYYNIPVIVIRNLLEENVIETRKNFKHIEYFNECVELIANFKNTKVILEAEKRVLKLLNNITESINGSTNVFVISDTDFYRILHIGNRKHTICEVDNVATAYKDKIYLNRKYLKGYIDLEDTSNTLTNDDIRFIMLNLETICHEMAHSFYGTTDNTKEHFECIINLMQQITNIIYS